MSQVRLIKSDGTDITYHGVSGVSATRSKSTGGHIIVRWKPDTPQPSFMEKHVPDDADIIYVMDDKGRTCNTYKLPGTGTISASGGVEVHEPGTVIAGIVTGEVPRA